MSPIEEIALYLSLDDKTIKHLIEKYQIPVFIVDGVNKLNFNRVYIAYLTECSRLWNIKNLIVENSDKCTLLKRLIIVAECYFDSGTLKTKYYNSKFFYLVMNMTKAHYFKLLYCRQSAHTGPGSKLDHTDPVFYEDALNQVTISSKNFLQGHFIQILECLIQVNNSFYFEILQEFVEELQLREISLVEELKKESQSLKDISIILWCAANETENENDVFDDIIEDEEDQGDDV